MKKVQGRGFIWTKQEETILVEKYSNTKWIQSHKGYTWKYEV